MRELQRVLVAADWRSLGDRSIDLVGGLNFKQRGNEGDFLSEMF